jgi:hypothetical protein
MKMSPKRVFLLIGFWVSSITFIAILGISICAFASGISDMLRFHTPDNLGLGIGFAIFSFGCPFMLIALLTGLKLVQHRKNSHDEEA